MDIRAAVLRINNANLSSTIDVKFEIINKRIGSVQFESEVLRKPALHIAKPLKSELQSQTQLTLPKYRTSCSETWGR